MSEMPDYLEKKQETLVPWWQNVVDFEHLSYGSNNDDDLYHASMPYLQAQAVKAGKVLNRMTSHQNYREGFDIALENLVKSWGGRRAVQTFSPRFSDTPVGAFFVWDDGVIYLSFDVHGRERNLASRPADDEDDDEGYIVEDNGVRRISVIFKVCSLSEKHVKDVMALSREYEAPPVKYIHRDPGAAYILANVPMHGLQIIKVGLAGTDLIRDNYTPDVITAFDRAVADLQTDKPRGRLVVLEGPPGTGKTYLVRAFMNSVPKSKFVIVPPHLVQQLADPGMILTFLRDMNMRGNDAPLVLVLEDADTCLTERKAENIAAISTILNLSDGIIGSLLDLRIIATTNTPVAADGKGLDMAILRKGRMSAHLKVGPLPPSSARDVWKRLTGDEVGDEIKGGATVADIYAAATEYLERKGLKAPEKEKEPLAFAAEAQARMDEEDLLPLGR